MKTSGKKSGSLKIEYILNNVMKTSFKKYAGKKTILLLLLLMLLVVTAAYYRFCYRSVTVDGGIVKLYKVFSRHTAALRGIRFSPDGKYIASGSVDSTVMIWKKESGEVVQVLKHPEGVTCLDFSPDGKWIVTGAYDGMVRLWNVADGKLTSVFAGHARTVWTVAFSPDGKSVASAGEDTHIDIREVASGRITHILRGHTLTVWAVKFSPDGTRLASGSFDNDLKIWNTADGKLIRNIAGHTEAIVDIAFAHDGKRIASTSDDKTIKVWKVNDGTLLRTMEVPEHMQAVAFSPDDKRLLTGGCDKPVIGELLQNFMGDSEIDKGVSARLWDVETGTLLQTFREHKNDVSDVAYSDDGRWIATASEDKTVDVWQVIK
jgi:WD40 repeat protein